MAQERTYVDVPDKFDNGNQRMVEMLTAKVSEKKGPGWVVDSFDPGIRRMHFVRETEVTQVNRGSGDSLLVELGRMVKATEGERVSQKLEDDNPGYFLTEFRPHLKQARLSRLNDDERRCREAVAGVIGVPRWEIQVSQRSDGGFSLILPPKYSPAKHDRGLQAVADEVVGREGWLASIDARTLRGELIPAEPPTFPAMISYPFKAKARSQWSIPVGERLGGLGEANTPLEMDFSATAGTMVSGTAGGGKSVGINAMLFGFLSRGWEVAIGDINHKQLDFTWMKPWVRENGWGCDSLAHTVAMLGEVYEQKERRTELLNNYGVQKLQDLPDSVRPRPIVVIMDELTALFTQEPIPKGLPKDHPMVMEAQQQNLEVELMKKFVRRIPAELRFVGIRIILASQISQANTGVDSTMKTNLPNRLLFGAAATKNQRGHALLNPEGVPEVPSWVQNDKSAARGSGLFEFEGVEPGVFKSYFASTDDYRARLEALRLPTTINTTPSPSTIEKHVISLTDSAEDEGFGRKERTLEAWELGPDGRPLQGRERANAARHQATIGAAG
ncbi:FtsK/SpoIIIE domain-containing protein [Leucobacter sp. cx-169]|uniref:FtsK/SpoIIIE domain-containing protein n=1 Tax=Leucobacter sp. cx-169 TaxID=2770549 RepID=UPI00165E09AE|nr:FtsK/SpoIIIE domain-containing protein [Leucobacter sp. cx-169]MBC9927307.1 hypothetical protein [Leucobacter sp. cx-169]